MNGQPSVEHHPGFTLARVYGSPYQRGLQHGVLLRDGIHRLRAALYRDVINHRGRPLGLVLQAAMAPFLTALHRHIPADLRREMRGVAAGAGIRYWDVLLFNCFDDLLHSLWLIPTLAARLPFVGGRLACSSFVLLAERTTDSRLLHGRNLDYEVFSSYLVAEGAVPRALRENVVVLEQHPDRGHDFLSVGWPGVIGVVTGLNAAGLSLACLTSALSGETPNGIPLPLLYRRISQEAATIDAADPLLRDAKRTIGNNLVVASGPANDARVFELSPRLVASRPAREGAAVATNHFVHEAMAARQDGWVAPNSIDRLTRLTTLCASSTVAADRAASFLRDTRSLAPDGNPWSCLENPGTIYSTVAEPASGRLWLRVNDRAEREFVELRASWAAERELAGRA